MLRTHLTLAACLLISHVTLGAQNYSVQLVVDAGDPQHHSASPTALTDDGLVGGRIWNVDLFQFNAFVWRDGQVTTVAQSPAGSSGVTAINSTGVVVGTTFVPTLPAGNDTFVYRDGATTLYPATTFVPYGINDDGIMAGSTGAHAATFDGRAVTDLGTFGGTVARGVAINESGQVVSEATFRPRGRTSRPPAPSSGTARPVSSSPRSAGRRTTRARSTTPA